ncbi:MAG: bifunctional lysylphosphatidylglycerol flippase/synthetase MprF, partial [Phycisphaeraceae bacterium]|nr:bifunctional lysylphosphatidylglycerol flippase/synthetase MprF [Phycisphaeraceae bacterium]
TTILGGSAARYRIYSAMGLSVGELARLVAFCAFTFWLGFLTIGGLVFLLVPTQLPVGIHWPIGSVRLIGGLFLALVTAYLALVLWRKKPLRWRSWEMPTPGWGVSVGQLAIASLDWFLTGAILFVLLPANTHIGFPLFMSLFLLAQAAGLISSVPGGLGVFESAMLLLMTDWVEPHSLISSLLLLRLIYYLLPLLIGALLLGIHELAPHRVLLLRRWGNLAGDWGANIVPHFFAFTTLIAGMILLFSGALPSAQGRMTWLRHGLPLPAVEISHFLGSVVGAGLLMLARGLQRRLGLAYLLTVALLFLGVVFSLTKGWDYEEAILLSLMLLAILPCRREFHRRASLLSGGITPSWLTLMGIGIIATLWLGIFAYKKVEYADSLWWRFAFQADAPRFLRATTGAAGLIVVVALAQLLRPRTPLSGPASQAQHDELFPLVRKSPRTQAYLALLGDKSFLFNASRESFIMYAVQGRSWIALGDPVGPREQWQDLLWQYRELCDRYGGWPVFYQLDTESLDLYIQLGLSFIKLGEEARVDLSTFSLEGSPRRDLRSARNKLSKAGYTFEIQASPLPGDLLDSLRAISDAWLKDKNTREKGFSLGFFQPDYLSHCPVALIRHNEQIIAFANLWEGAAHEELSADLVRYLPDSPHGIMDYLLVELLLWGQTQGYRWFNFGMAPLSGLEDNDLAPFWSQAGAYVFRMGEHFYNFQGLRAYKEKFSPVWRPKYLACPRGMALPRVLTNLATLTSGGLKGIVAK